VRIEDGRVIEILKGSTHLSLSGEVRLSTRDVVLGGVAGHDEAHGDLKLVHWVSGSPYTGELASLPNVRE
jgi:hypothetical protein